ncbi:uncharacterized protein [Asterias amurensis]|uniref:uncharacterized protein n=1 Tax=Asterias amurensis TaxID=7602 RepID=UPI003AB86D7D
MLSIKTEPVDILMGVTEEDDGGQEPHWGPLSSFKDRPDLLVPTGASSKKRSGARVSTKGIKRPGYRRRIVAPFSYVDLIKNAIKSAPNCMLTLREILSHLEENNECFRGSYVGWKNSVRHNLSVNDCFVKLLRHSHRPFDTHAENSYKYEPQLLWKASSRQAQNYLTMEATRLALALLVGSLVIGMCLSKPAQKEKRMQRRHEERSLNCSGGDDFLCMSGGCVPGYWQCDGMDDCPDGDDEFGCFISESTGGCQAGSEYTCASGDCIYANWQCDGWTDCPHGDDEEGCNYESIGNSDLPSFEFSWNFGSDYVGGSEWCDYQCYSGDCIFSSWVCDGITDCSQGEDESNCDPFFDQDLLHYCLLSDVVVPTWMACDRIIDCPFGDDEWLGCYGIHDGFGFNNKKRGAEKLPTQLSKMAKKHMKTEKSLTEEQKQLLKTINEKQSVMKKGRLGARKALDNAV